MKNDQFTEISQTVGQMVSHPLRPLSALRSIKMKIGILVLGAVATTVVVYWIGLQFGLVWPSVAGIVAACVALIVTRFFAAGLTTPLREMAEVSEKMSRGDYSARVQSTSQDEIGALAQTFNAMADELAQTETLRKELIANASHELKTPLTALQAQLENIVDNIEAPTPEKMTALLAQTEHLSALVKQLLDLSRLESGIVNLDVSDVDVSLLLASARDVAISTNPTITFDLDLSTHMIRGDFHRLLQVFTNLYGNAARYCPADGIIRSRISEDDNGIVITVEDNGPGINEASRNHVFDRFYRVDSARNSKDGGAGIGLAITKQIILMHGGKIVATESELGGCQIEISLPRTQTHISTHISDDARHLQERTQPTNIKEMTSWHSIPSTT
jgi:signal transduction histidine kinase